MGRNEVAAMHPLIREVYDASLEGRWLCAEMAHEKNESVWVQVTAEYINMAYPFTDDPTDRLEATAVEGRETLTLDHWEAGVYATFTYEGSASSHDVAVLVDRLFVGVLGLPSSEAYPLATSVFELPIDEDEDEDEPREEATPLADRGVPTGRC
jgi:hypothetical protein